MNNIEIYQAENGGLDRDSAVAKIATTANDTKTYKTFDF